MSRIRPLSVPCVVDVLETRGLRRVLGVSGSVAAKIELDLRKEGEQILRVNGRLVQRRSSLLGYNTLFKFEIPSVRGRVPASLETHITLWRGLTALRLRVRGTVVYSEGLFPGELGEQHMLPIPADHPHPSQVGLPTPASPPSLHTGDLPLPLAAVPGWEAVSPLREAARRQMQQRVSTAGVACLLSGLLFGGVHSISRMREEQLYGPRTATVATPPPIQTATRRPRKQTPRTGPSIPPPNVRPYMCGPVPDPTPHRLTAR